MYSACPPPRPSAPPPSSLTFCSFFPQPACLLTIMRKPITRSASSAAAMSAASSSSTISQMLPSSSSSKIAFRSQKIRKRGTHKATFSTITTTAALVSSSSSLPGPTTAAVVKVKPLSLKGEIDAALEHLSRSDPLLASLILSSNHQPPAFDCPDPPFLSLAKSILYQQLAPSAAKSIYTRFLSLCGGESAVHPNKLLSLSAHQLRQIGISGRKASYLHDLADKFKCGSLSDSSILQMDDDDMLLTRLTEVKGIGVWTVHMFMIFTLHRPDVLPVGDLGVRKGVQRLYGLKELPQPALMEQLCHRWRPYRSVGSWYMWRLMEAATAAAAANSSLPNNNDNNNKSKAKAKKDGR